MKAAFVKNDYFPPGRTLAHIEIAPFRAFRSLPLSVQCWKLHVFTTRRFYCFRVNNFIKMLYLRRPGGS